MPGYPTRGWYNATLPSTVFHALVENRVYADPYTGANLRSVAGVTYPIGFNFSNAPMPPESPFRRSWWYRTEFKLSPGWRGRTVWLGFDGINFRANVWLNGHQIAASDKLAGAWRLFTFDVTSAVNPDGSNALAIEIFPPQPHDLAITFVDWNPQPPDKNMGLWRDVFLTTTGPVAIQYPTVTTHFNLPSNVNLPSIDRAQLTIRAELKNAAATAVDGVLKGRIENLEFSQPVRLGPHETRVVHFTPDRFPQLKMDNPRVWWPAQVGPQNLYGLDLQFEALQSKAGGAVSDSSHIDFGIREVTSEIDAKGHRLFHINGRNILIRGAGYTFDMLLHTTPERQEAELRYVRDMNLNTIRFEGKIEDDTSWNCATNTASWCWPAGAVATTGSSGRAGTTRTR